MCCCYWLDESPKIIEIGDQMSREHDKLDSWNKPFDLNRDGKMRPEEKALRDATIMGMMDDDNGGGGSGAGCCLPAFLLIVGIPGSLISAVIYGIVHVIMKA